jgi:hypothetical protein
MAEFLKPFQPLFTPPPKPFTQHPGLLYEHRLCDAQFRSYHRLLAAGFKFLALVTLLIYLDYRARALQPDASANAIVEAIQQLQLTQIQNLTQINDEVEKLRRLWDGLALGRKLDRILAAIKKNAFDYDKVILTNPSDRNYTVLAADRFRVFNLPTDFLYTNPRVETADLLIKPAPGAVFSVTPSLDRPFVTQPLPLTTTVFKTLPGSSSSQFYVATSPGVSLSTAPQLTTPVSVSDTIAHASTDATTAAVVALGATFTAEFASATTAIVAGSAAAAATVDASIIAQTAALLADDILDRERNVRVTNRVDTVPQNGVDPLTKFEAKVTNKVDTKPDLPNSINVQLADGTSLSLSPSPGSVFTVKPEGDSLSVRPADGSVFLSNSTSGTATISGVLQVEPAPGSVFLSNSTAVEALLLEQPIEIYPSPGAVFLSNSSALEALLLEQPIEIYPSPDSVFRSNSTPYGFPVPVAPTPEANFRVTQAADTTFYITPSTTATFSVYPTVGSVFDVANEIGVPLEITPAVNAVFDTSPDIKTVTVKPEADSVWHTDATNAISEPVYELHCDTSVSDCLCQICTAAFSPLTTGQTAFSTFYLSVHPAYFRCTNNGDSISYQLNGTITTSQTYRAFHSAFRDFTGAPTTCATKQLGSALLPSAGTFSSDYTDTDDMACHFCESLFSRTSHSSLTAYYYVSAIPAYVKCQFHNSALTIRTHVISAPKHTDFYLDRQPDDSYILSSSCSTGTSTVTIDSGIDSFCKFCYGYQYDLPRDTILYRYFLFGYGGRFVCRYHGFAVNVIISDYTNKDYQITETTYYDYSDLTDNKCSG